MIIHLDQSLFEKIQTHGEEAYPEEGAGLILGVVEGHERRIRDILPLENSLSSF